MPEGSPNPPTPDLNILTSGRKAEANSPVENKRPIRVLIVDDHDPVRRGIRLLLSSDASVSICGEAADGIDAVEKAAELRPDVVLMDITMPRMDGLQATRAIKQVLPATRVILVSQNDPEIVQHQAAKINADGFVVKSELSQYLVPAILGAAAKRDDEPKHELASDTEAQSGTVRKSPRGLNLSASSLAMLREHRERLELMAQASEVGFWFCDLPFDKLVWDERVKEHFWYPPDAEITIDMFYERLHADDRERTKETIERCIANKETYDIEYRTVSDDGRTRWVRAIGSPF